MKDKTHRHIDAISFSELLTSPFHALPDFLAQLWVLSILVGGTDAGPGNEELCDRREKLSVRARQ